MVFLRSQCLKQSKNPFISNRIIYVSWKTRRPTSETKVGDVEDIIIDKLAEFSDALWSDMIICDRRGREIVLMRFKRVKE